MKLKYIDAIRGIAILMVMIVHTSQLGLHDYPYMFKTFVGLGAKGVQLFFMASAFTLFLTYEYHLSSERYVNLNFVVRRVFRIAPMYFIGILYFSWINGYDSTGVLISNFFFIHGISPYWINDLVPGGWSITVEMTFYAILPYLVSKIKNFDSALTYTIITMFIAFLLKCLLMEFPLINSDQLWGQFLYYYFPNQLPIFCLGIVAYFMIVKKDFILVRRKIKFFAIFFLIFLLLVGYLVYDIALPWHFVISIGFLGLIYILSKKEFLFFVNGFTCFFGKISFSAYLIHFAVLGAMAKFKFTDFIIINTPLDTIFNFGIRLFFVLIVTAMLSRFFYSFIEIPFQKLGKKIIFKIEEKKKYYSFWTK